MTLKSGLMSLLFLLVFLPLHSGAGDYQSLYDGIKSNARNIISLSSQTGNKRAITSKAKKINNHADSMFVESHKPCWNKFIQRTNYRYHYIKNQANSIKSLAATSRVSGKINKSANRIKSNAYALLQRAKKEVRNHCK